MTKRIAVTLDQDVYEAATRISQQSGERLGKVLSDLARQTLLKNRQRFPTFDVPPGAPTMSAEKIQRIIDDEVY